MTRLTDLGAQFVVDDGESIWADRTGLSLAEAQGVRFDDPIKGSCVVCWFRGRGVPDSSMPRGGRWEVSGTGLDDLTLNPSVDLSCGGKYPGQWHGWVKNGEVT